ncbi:hypothetical protein G9A89_010258 [Geosiphon pyriformis]|nr:hypothetical protein G9A89_010258 [Geosiphon pyriformis]
MFSTLFTDYDHYFKHAFKNVSFPARNKNDTSSTKFSASIPSQSSKSSAAVLNTENYSSKLIPRVSKSQTCSRKYFTFNGQKSRFNFLKRRLRSSKNMHDLSDIHMESSNNYRKFFTQPTFNRKPLTNKLSTKFNSVFMGKIEEDSESLIDKSRGKGKQKGKERARAKSQFYEIYSNDDDDDEVIDVDDVDDQ